LNTVSIHPVVQTVRSELVYKFNPGGGTAYAARPILKAPPAVYNWTGFYVGGGFGYGMFNLDTQWTGVFDPFTMPLTQKQGGRGWLGTATVGGDFQFSDRIVAGVFADYDWARIKGNIQYQTAFEVGTVKETAAWAVGARVGWLVTPAILSYINGGYTQARFSEVHLVNNHFGNQLFGANIDTVPGHTYGGWFVGSGVEAKLDGLGPVGQGWFWRTEYRYAKYNGATLPNVCTDPIICPSPPIVVPVGTVLSTVAIQPAVQTLRAELVYKIN
jgi:outer membrane immunogenic protein